ncbi:cell division protein FtsZ [Taibaiella chishuiensis]|uniref:Cell division protein FtsZ n=1 Tax=Taibaiella chishuiensis TaxID=1434707 RepID=A0A2P8DBZ6_9BACT|nr:cell division protein FtsZ [Taibaiella chishuiensis]PSK94729.1 cell division protein FtsZ [Taibaiella chishuiensis]
MIHFEIPKNQSSIIKVIGVGGGGGNAVNYMYGLGIEGVDFIVCNTDSQALAQSPVPNKIQLGPHLTQGLGAGANPEIGKQAGEESVDEISKILKVNTRMAFITAGMGGGTGTGGAPIIAKVCRELGILTVGIVTTPFAYEGRKRLKQAQEGIEAMREHVDTILIISNDKLRQQYGNLPFTQAFSKADNVLATAAKCITDLITVDGKVNLDFNDVQTVMKNGGVAILGSALSSGEGRARQAVEEALSSPLLNDSEIEGAQWILLNVTSAAGAHEHTLDELEIIQGYVQQQAGNTCDIILGMGHDPNLGENLSVTIIATGFHHTEINADVLVKKEPAPEKIVVELGQSNTGHNEVKADAAPPKQETDPLAPVLVEAPPVPQQPQPVYYTAPVAEPAPVAETRTSFNLELPKAQAEPQPVIPQQPPVQEYKAPELELIIKNEQAQQPLPQQETQVKRGDRFLSPDELEEQRRFEEQKRALEERAERLRRMSFNIQGNENPSDIENIPAYMRNKANLDDQVSSSDPYLSGYSVNSDKNGNQGNISTINTFLDGKKPD